MCERPALRTCSWPFSKPPRETLLRRDLTTKEQFDEHSIQRDARIFRRAESRASIDVGDPAFFLVGAAGVVGEPVDLFCAPRSSRGLFAGVHGRGHATRSRDYTAARELLHFRL